MRQSVNASGRRAETEECDQTWCVFLRPAAPSSEYAAPLPINTPTAKTHHWPPETYELLFDRHVNGLRRSIIETCSASARICVSRAKRRPASQSARAGSRSIAVRLRPQSRLQFHGGRAARKVLPAGLGLSPRIGVVSGFAQLFESRGTRDRLKHVDRNGACGSQVVVARGAQSSAQ